MINKLLATAVNLYLRSQVSQIQDLQVKITGKNRQILKGCLPKVFLTCQNAIYQGLHLSQIEIEGLDIAFNLSEVLSKQPLRLLEPIVISVNLNLSGQDLQASVNSELLQSGLRDLWQIILARDNFPTTISEINITKIVWYELTLIEGELYSSGTYQQDNELKQELQITLKTRICLGDVHTLSLSKIEIFYNETEIFRLLEPAKVNLGTEVILEQLTISSEEIFFSGKITVR